MKQLVTLAIIVSTGFSWAQKENPTSGAGNVPEPPQEEITRQVDEPAEFPGGMTAMKKFIAANLVYPESAKDAGIQGKCYLNFVVGADGKISDIKIMRGVPDCPDCDKAAVRVVKQMPDWIPGKVAGKPVKSSYNLPVVFKPE
jgi:protein TonB